VNGIGVPFHFGQFKIFGVLQTRTRTRSTIYTVHTVVQHIPVCVHPSLPTTDTYFWSTSIRQFKDDMIICLSNELLRTCSDTLTFIIPKDPSDVLILRLGMDVILSMSRLLVRGHIVHL
jgi:hypothetical protein